MLKEGALKSFVPLLKSHDGEAIHVALNYFEAMFKLLVGITDRNNVSKLIFNLLSIIFSNKFELCKICRKSLHSVNYQPKCISILVLMLATEKKDGRQPN